MEATGRVVKYDMPPLIIDDACRLIDGEGRLIEAAVREWETVPVRRYSTLSPHEWIAERLGIADDLLGEARKRVARLILTRLATIARRDFSELLHIPALTALEYATATRRDPDLQRSGRSIDEIAAQGRRLDPNPRRVAAFLSRHVAQSRSLTGSGVSPALHKKGHLHKKAPASGRQI